MSGSKGILEGFNKTSKEDKNLRSKEDKNSGSKEVRNLGVEEFNTKRSYSLRPSTVKKLQELKIFEYPDPQITYNEIVDEAICKLYDEIKSKK